MGRKYLGKRQCFHFCIACLIIALVSGCASLSGFRNRIAVNDHLKQGQRLFEQGDFRDAAKENQQALILIGRGDPADRALFNLGLIYAHPDNPESDYTQSVELFKKILEEYPDSPLFNNAKAWYSLLNDNMQSTIQIEHLSSINGYLLRTHELIKINNFEKALDLNQKALSLSGNEHRLDEILLQTDELIKISNFKKALDLNQKALSTSDKKHRLDEILFNIGLIHAHHDNPEKNYKVSIEYFERLITEYPESPLSDQAKVWRGLLDVIEKSKQVDIEIDQKKKELAR